MNKAGGIGVGSASIVLVFTVLCLAVFAIITHTVAANDKALVDAETQLVIQYYEADALGERVLAEILESEIIPEVILGIEIYTDWDWDIMAETVAFYCPITDDISLYVKAAIYRDSFDAIIWRMQDEGEWITDDFLNLWPGI